MGETIADSQFCFLKRTHDRGPGEGWRLIFSPEIPVNINGGRVLRFIPEFSASGGDGIPWWGGTFMW